MPMLGTGGTCRVCNLKPGQGLFESWCGPEAASSSMLTAAYMSGRASCSLAICIHLFSKKTRLQGGLLLSTLQMLLRTNSMCSLCLPCLCHWKRSGLNIWSLLSLTKGPKKKDCVSINDLLLCLGATVLQDFTLMVLSQERTNLTNFINSSLF